MSEKGRVKFYNSEGGYGFIEREGGRDTHIGKDSFGGKSPSEGDHVEFDIVKQPRGPHAKNLRIIQNSSKKSEDSHHTADSLDISKTKLPEDTRNVLGGFKNVDNFHLRFNKLARFEEDKFKFFETDRKGVKYQIRANFSDKFFTNVAQRFYGSIKRLNLKFSDDLVLTPEWRMVVGLGNESVYETSMTLHHIYGIPYIPGSALKGIMRHSYIGDIFEQSEIDDFEQILVLEKILENSNIEKDKNIAFNDFVKNYTVKVKRDKEEHKIIPTKKMYDFFLNNTVSIKNYQTLFGTQDNVGNIMFLDAFPLSLNDKNLENDVMTNHYEPYYSDNDNRTPPADYFNPVPIKFLTVKNTNFQFGLILKPNIGMDISEIKSLISDTLENYGIGAKTAVGYGYFKNLEDQTKVIHERIEREQQQKEAIIEEKKLENMTEIERECYLLKKMPYNEAEPKSFELYKKIDAVEMNEKIIIAKTLKEVWQNIGKWETKAISKKQKIKVAKIKSILEGET